MLSFKTRDEIPEPIRGEFIEVGGAWVPDGYVPATTHEEMKQKANPARLAELEAAAKAWGDLDPAKARAALAEAETLRAAAEAKAAGVEPEKLKELLEERTGKLKTDHEAVLQAERESAAKLQQQLADASARLDDLEIGGSVKDAAASIQDFRKEALRDATDRALKVFKREDGKIVGRDGEGKPLYINGKPATPQAWLEAQREQVDAKHWFKAPSGSGASGNESPAGAGRKTRPHSDYSTMTTAERVEFAEAGGEFV